MVQDDQGCAGNGATVRQVNALLVPAVLREGVLSMAHDHPKYEHKGQVATYDLIRTSYYWPGMYADS